MSDQTIPEAHRRALDDGIRASLLRAGIGATLHDRSLSEVTGGDALVEWVKANGKPFFRGGGVALFVGHTSGTVLAMNLFARALHLSGVGVRVASLPALVKALDRDDDEYLGKLAEAPVLVLPRFYAPATRNDTPLTGWQTLMVEEYLTERKSNGRGLVAHAYERFEGQKNPVWWRSDFLTAMATDAKIVEIA